VARRQLGAIVNDLAERYTKVRSRRPLDALKESGFHWATRAGVTISIGDVVTTAAEERDPRGVRGRADKVQGQYEKGLITDDERRQELIEIWTRATNEVAEAMEENFPSTNPVWMMVHSGARGNMMQVRPDRGHAWPGGPTPRARSSRGPSRPTSARACRCSSTSSRRTVARKGLADTALRTADSGYLTRRLVDVSQDVIIREDDCGTERGLVKRIAQAATASVRRTTTSRPRLRPHARRRTHAATGTVSAPRRRPR
jgi:DNA-directed RNA polymerase subunit beta'